ncbi:MAG TPA: CvpA family protein [Tepidiformaceae bacterium]|nr:CvpA family protein [Tepidiformaceae bacterium]
MNWLDVVLVAAIGFSTWSGFRNGFIRELVSIAAVILAIPVAGIFYDDMFPKVEPIVDNENLAALISFVSILLGVVIGGQVVAHLLKRTAEILNLGVLDRLAGAAFGFLKAVFLAQALLLALVTFPNPDIRSSVDGSPVASELIATAPPIKAFLPQAFEEGLDLFHDHVKGLDDLLPGETPTPAPSR